jgi:hypothetical protein
MLNETTVIQTLSNESNVVQTFSGIVVPTVAIVMSAIVTIYVAYMSIKFNTKSVFVLANKDKMNQQIIMLGVAARSGKIDKIEEVLNSRDNYYIPDDLKKKIKIEMEKENSPWYSFYGLLKWKDKTIKYFENKKYPPLHERILKIINKYLSP